MSSSVYRRLVPYGVAIVSTSIAILLSIWLQPFIERTIGAFFYIAIVVTTWYGGIGPGAVATVLSALAINYLFIPPIHQFSIASSSDIVRLGVFLLVAFVIDVLSSNLWLARRRVEQLSQQLLRESRDRLQMALTAAQMGMWDWNLVTGEIVWSPEHEQLLGLAPGMFDGKYETFEARVHPDDRAELTQAVQAALQAGTIYQHEYRVVWADGSVHWVEGRGQAVYDQSDQAVRMSGTLMNIDHRKQAEFALQQLMRDLEQRVVERTNELQQANDRLQAELEQRSRFEQELQESASSLRQLSTALENAVAGISRLDPQGCYVSVNYAYAHSAGYEPDEMLGMNWQKTVCPDDIEKMILAYQQMLRDGKVEVEAKGIRKDGSVFYKQLVMISAYDEQHQFIGHHCFMKDITDRKQAEATLRQSESTNRALINAIPDLLIRVRADGTYLDFLANSDINFIDPKRVQEGLYIYDVLPLHQAEERLGYIRQVLQTNQILSYEYELLINNQLHYEEARIVPLQEDEVLVVVRDIGDRKQSEAALQESNRRWRSLLDNVELVVIELDLNGTIEYVNPFFLQLTHYDLEDVIGRYWFDSFLSPGQSRSVAASFRQGLEHTFPTHYQNSILTQSGEERMIAWNNTVLRDAAGQPIGTISIGEDITERHRLERMKAEFISVVSHELRTPLTSMQAALSLLVEKIIDPTSKEGETIIQIAADGVDRLVRLVSDILDLERLDSGKVRLEKRLCNTAHLIAAAVDQMQEMANQAGVTLEATCSAFEIHADPDRLLQVLTNLLSNAIKFSSTGSTVLLKVGLTNDSSSSAPLLRFTVQDQGRGIPANKLDRIFERFQQVDSSDSRQKGGTGLGLAICRSIVQQHGGHIWAESTVDQGSCFYFTVPLESENTLIAVEPGS